MDDKSSTLQHDSRNVRQHSRPSFRIFESTNEDAVPPPYSAESLSSVLRYSFPCKLEHKQIRQNHDSSKSDIDGEYFPGPRNNQSRHQILTSTSQRD